jgi:hypothetical protein
MQKINSFKLTNQNEQQHEDEPKSHYRGDTKLES